MIAKFACFVHPNTVPFSVFSAMACNGQGLKLVENFCRPLLPYREHQWLAPSIGTHAYKLRLKAAYFVMNTEQGGHNLSIYPAKLIRD